MNQGCEDSCGFIVFKKQTKTDANNWHAKQLDVQLNVLQSITNTSGKQRSGVI